MMKVAWLPVGLRESLRSVYSLRAVPSRPLLSRSITTTKQFTTSSRCRAGIAAPEIKFRKGSEGDDAVEEPLFHARLVPESPSYFTAQPTFTDDLLILQSLLRRHAALPVLNQADVPRTAWRSLIDYRNMAGESVKAAKYHKIVATLQRLNSIQPVLMPPEVKAALEEYRRDVNPYQNAKKIASVDRFGRALGAGRRKSSTATAYVVEGTGEVLINGKTLAEAFGRIHDRESAIWALKATDRVDKYNVWGIVSGGGTTGQAEALTLAVAKALLAHEPALKPALRRAGCVTRDPRRVERKKPGHVKARKMPAWVKR